MGLAKGVMTDEQWTVCLQPKTDAGRVELKSACREIQKAGLGLGLPKSATLTSAYALADACTSTVPISRRTFSDLLSACRGGGGGFYTKVTTCAQANGHFSKCQATARDQVYSLPVLESCRFNGETRSAKQRNPYGMMHSAMRQRKKLSNRLALESLWKHYC